MDRVQQVWGTRWFWRERRVQIPPLVAKVKSLDFVLSTMKGGSTLWSGAGARLPVPQSPHLYDGHTGKHLSVRAVVRI